MTKRYSDPHAARLWRQCKNNSDLRWLLENVLTPKKTRAAGRVLLISPHEFLGEVNVPFGKKLSLQFRQAGFPYLSRDLNILLSSFNDAVSDRRIRLTQRDEAMKGIDAVVENSRQQFQDRIVLAVMETIRQNESLRRLTQSKVPLSISRIRKRIPDYSALNWTAIKGLAGLFEIFLRKKASKKAINRFTLNFNTLLNLYQPEIAHETIVLSTAMHFVKLLKARGITENAWKQLLIELIDRRLVVPFTALFFWCPRCAHGGFASTSLSYGQLPPFCPSCGHLAHAMAGFVPDTFLLRATKLKDGLLGAAIGWHLRRRRIPFRHALPVRDTEVDFIAEGLAGNTLIESKILHVLVTSKQMARNLRESMTQLVRHREMLENDGWRILKAVCVVNLSDRELKPFRPLLLSELASGSAIVGYDRFTRWLANNLSR